MAGIDVETALDINEIQSLKAGYCETIDDLANIDSMAARLRDIFAEDFTADHAGHPFADRESFIAHLTSSACSAAVRWHGLSSPQVKVEGDRAFGRWTVVARSQAQGADEPIVVFGRYADEFRRTPAGWLLARSQFHLSRS